MIRLLVKAVLPLVILAVAAAGAYLLWSTRPEVAAKPPQEQVRTVATVTAVLIDARPTMRLFGAVVAGREVELGPLVAGRVIEVGVDFVDGGVVRAGDLLVAIDRFDYEAEAAEVRARIAEARARLNEIGADLSAAGRLLEHDREQLELATRDVARREKLQGSPAGSEKAFDDARLAQSERAQRVIERQQAIDRLAAQGEQQQAVIERWEVSLRRALRALADTRLVAPFGGYLVETNAAVGKRVERGERVARLIDADRLEAYFHLSGAEFARLLAGGGFRGRTAEVVWRLGEEAFAFDAVIDRVSGEIDPESGGVDLYARIADPGAGGVLRPGAFVEVNLADRVYPDVVRLPESALYDGGTVYVVVDGRLEARAVEMVARHGGEVLVRGGVVPDERVVTTRFPKIGPGVRVAVR